MKFTRLLLISLLCWIAITAVQANPADTLPTPPANVRCGDGKMGYGLYWTDKSTNEVKFKVYRAVNSTEKFAMYADVKSTSTATQGTQYYTKIEYLPENYYTYKVEAVNKAGKGNPSEITILAKRPASFSAVADSVCVMITWTDPQDSRMSFPLIEKSRYPDSAYQIITPFVDPSVGKFIDYSPEVGVDYYYRMRGAVYDEITRATCYTPPTNTVGPFHIARFGKDCDGEISYQERNYKYKTFGNQTWMIENLDYLPEVHPANSVSATEKKYYVSGYQGSDVSEAKKTENYRKYGVLYNWAAATDSTLAGPKDPLGVQGICPDGWHLPGNKEWVDLTANQTKAKAIRDSAISADAVRKGAFLYDPTKNLGNFALPPYRDFETRPGGWVISDSNKFMATGEIENYWSSTGRILISKDIRIENCPKETGLPVRCVKGAALPMVITNDITNISEKTAAVSARITKDGGAPIVSRGIYFNTLGVENAINDSTVNCNMDDSFVCNLNNLSPGTLYFVRTYADNIAGRTLGNIIRFVTAGKGANPTVFTEEVDDVLSISVLVRGRLTALGGSEVTEYGICWSTNRKPTLKDHVIKTEMDKMDFSCYVFGLIPKTTYYVRAFASNSFGTAYGTEKQFTTGEIPTKGTFEYAGRKYTYQPIGTQTWMTENLAYLPSVSPSELESEKDAHYYVYGYEGTNVDSAKSSTNYLKYGVLYNWKAATTACPGGWHLPSKEEIIILTNYLTNYGYGFGTSNQSIAKSMASNDGWDSFPMPGTVGENQISNNSSGFNALPAGQRSIYGTDKASDMGKLGIFWTGSVFGANNPYIYSLGITYSNSTVQPYPADKRLGFSIRCIKDK
jgi:uncharacterized protein (TIGR02145 family)